MKRIFTGVLLSLLIFLLPIVSFAKGEVKAPLLVTKAGHWFVQLGVGVGWPLKPDKVKVTTQASIPADLYRPKSSNTELLGTVGFGYSYGIFQKWLNRISLAVNYTVGLFGETKGDVFSYGLPAYLEYKYRYKMIHHTIMADLKFDFLGSAISPYLLAGAGVSINNANGYKERALPRVNIPRFSLAFASRTVASFAYQFGAGLDWRANQHWIFSLGYLFTDAGKVELGVGKIRPGVKGPDQYLRLNSVLFSCSYQI